MSAGNCSSDPDGAARNVLRKAGLDSYFIHITGHGIGLRYHESIPILMPGSVEVLQEGMVSSVEPGVYIRDWGAFELRITWL
jgi:Xaa-Pro aminopeptidase